jgi:5-(carboxyamino)imidazole ribonucleotide synthase
MNSGTLPSEAFPAGAPTTSAVVGMIGGGQLARMTHQAAIGLGIELVVLTADGNDPAIRAGARHHPGHPDDIEALIGLAERCDVVTLDHELVPNAHLRALVAAGYAVRPGPEALRLAQDKAFARRALGDAGFAVPAFAEVARGDVAAVDRFAKRCGWPLVLKSSTGGYDGRGVEVIRDQTALQSSALARSADPWLIEEHVPIAHELAVLVARRPSGWWAAYPVIETTQHDGICRELVMPADVPPEVSDRVTALAISIANGLDTTGVLAVEFFVATDGRVLVNELATRPHNSGHATIEATVTSQFENHLRAVLDWPLGDTRLCSPAAAMVNLIGGDEPIDPGRLAVALQEPAVHAHLYGKTFSRGRKLGHLTALASNSADALALARSAARSLVVR